MFYCGVMRPIYICIVVWAHGAQYIDNIHNDIKLSRVRKEVVNAMLDQQGSPYGIGSDVCEFSEGDVSHKHTLGKYNTYNDHDYKNNNNNKNIQLTNSQPPIPNNHFTSTNS